ncbi:MAG: hypothetical protein QOE77_3356 [Blastocatellia bacterium]|nr:hypothetical protein [Blastocatellia bacterium]
MPDFENYALAPEEPNVYRLCSQPLSGAPAERNVLVDEDIELYISLRWSEAEAYGLDSLKTFGPSDTGRFGPKQEDDQIHSDHPVISWQPALER